MSTFLAAFVVSLHPGCPAERLQFPLLLAEGSSEMLCCSSVPLSLWTSESCTSVLWTEIEGAALPVALPIPSLGLPHRTLPPAQYLGEAFKYTLKGKRAEKGRNQRLHSSRRSIAWHWPLLVPMAPLSSSLLCSWVFYSIYFSFFCYYAFLAFSWFHSSGSHTLGHFLCSPESKKRDNERTTE